MHRNAPKVLKIWRRCLEEEDRLKLPWTENILHSFSFFGWSTQIFTRDHHLRKDGFIVSGVKIDNCAHNLFAAGNMELRQGIINQLEKSFFPFEKLLILYFLGCNLPCGNAIPFQLWPPFLLHLSSIIRSCLVMAMFLFWY